MDLAYRVEKRCEIMQSSLTGREIYLPGEKAGKESTMEGQWKNLNEFEIRATYQGGSVNNLLASNHIYLCDRCMQSICHMHILAQRWKKTSM